MSTIRRTDTSTTYSINGCEITVGRRKEGRTNVALLSVTFAVPMIEACNTCPTGANPSAQVLMKFKLPENVDTSSLEFLDKAQRALAVINNNTPAVFSETGYSGLIESPEIIGCGGEEPELV